jgi:hypothetical protein
MYFGFRNLVFGLIDEFLPILYFPLGLTGKIQAVHFFVLLYGFGISLHFPSGTTLLIFIFSVFGSPKLNS